MKRSHQNPVARPDARSPASTLQTPGVRATSTSSPAACPLVWTRGGQNQHPPALNWVHQAIQRP